MKAEITDKEIKERIELNYKRLLEPYYQIENVFSPSDYDWYGDKEGRALLSFVSLYKATGNKIPCMEEMLNVIKSKLNEKLYFGPAYKEGGYIREEQLSGHSWFLRGLCEHYEQFGDSLSLELIKSVVEGLYVPIKGKFNTYPIHREKTLEGGVSGSSGKYIGQWDLSSDIGCAFMSIDGITHAYKILGDTDVRSLADEMIDTFLSIDIVKLGAQTHCSLTAARGMVRMYLITKEEKYLDGAKKIFDLYVNHGGMTYTYQNLNWWQRPDSWTEPCAIVDSFMVAMELYKITGDENYRFLAARIYHNGLSTSQRSNGGAGTDSLICEGNDNLYLSLQMEEAFFCCSMRLSEGLWYIHENKKLFHAVTEGEVKKNEKGIYCDGDIIYCEPSENLLPYAENLIEIDGKKLTPIIKYYKVPMNIAKEAKMRIVF